MNLHIESNLDKEHRDWLRAVQLSFSKICPSEAYLVEVVGWRFLILRFFQIDFIWKCIIFDFSNAQSEVEYVKNSELCLLVDKNYRVNCLTCLTITGVGITQQPHNGFILLNFQGLGFTMGFQHRILSMIRFGGTGLALWKRICFHRSVGLHFDIMHELKPNCGIESKTWTMEHWVNRGVHTTAFLLKVSPIVAYYEIIITWSRPQILRSSPFLCDFGSKFGLFLAIWVG